MKIISKHKDYYDYLQGIYGIDNYKIYKRTNVIKEEDFETEFDLKDKKKRAKQHFFYSFAINNKKYQIIKTVKGFFPVSKTILKELGYSKWRIEDIISSQGKSTDLNRKYRKPILISFNNEYNSFEVNQNSDPFMKSFHFHKILTAHELYIEVETFLGWIKDNPPIENNQTDVEKILSNGFDKKNQF